MKILIFGLPGAGKTTLAKATAERLRCAHFNADEVRAKLWPDLGFSPHARLIQAERMGWLCDQVTRTGGIAIADFVCPTEETRQAFDADLTVWVDRISECVYPDTQKLWQPPKRWDIRVVKGTPVSFWVDRICRLQLTRRGRVA